MAKICSIQAAGISGGLALFPAPYGRFFFRMSSPKKVRIW